MEIKDNRKDKKLTSFEDIEEGDVFQDGAGQFQIRTDEGTGCCLVDGTLFEHDDEDEFRVVKAVVTVTS